MLINYNNNKESTRPARGGSKAERESRERAESKESRETREGTKEKKRATNIIYNIIFF